MKKNTFKTSALLLGISLLFFASCTEDDGTIDPVDNKITVPTIYEFQRDKDDVATTSVDYPGQTTRQLLIQDIKIAIDKLGAAGAVELTSADDLLKYFDKTLTNDETLKDNILTSLSLPATVNTYYEVNSSKDLKGKVDPDYSTEVIADIENWVNILVANSQDANKLETKAVYIDENTGLDLAQAVQKTLLGAVTYSQMTKVYLADIEVRDNLEIIDGTNHTEMEHRFDEAFGYFGAARNFFDFDDNDLASKNGGVRYKDNFVQDGSIDWESEYNFGFSTNAGKRDLGSTTGTDYSKAIMDNFLKGRTAIVNKELDNLTIAKVGAMEGVEEIIAATAIHYINDVIADIEALKADPTTDPANYYKHHAEMYFFTKALRYNPNNRLTNWQTILEDYFVTTEVANPKAIVDDVTKVDDYKAKLLDARDFIQVAYSFDQTDVENW